MPDIRTATIRQPVVFANHSFSSSIFNMVTDEAPDILATLPQKSLMIPALVMSTYWLVGFGRHFAHRMDHHCRRLDNGDLFEAG